MTDLLFYDTVRKMTRKQERPTDDVIGQFQYGELIPLKGCWLRVAHIEDGVLVLALDSFTKRGQEIIEDMKAKAFAADLKEVQEDLLAPRI